MIYNYVSKTGLARFKENIEVIINNLRNKTDSHTGDEEIHISATERDSWNDKGNTTVIMKTWTTSDMS